MTRPSPALQEAMRAFLNGYVLERQLTAITLDQARDVLSPITPAGVTVDGMIVSRILRRLDFNRSYLPADAGIITYRKGA